MTLIRTDVRCLLPKVSSLVTVSVLILASVVAHAQSATMNCQDFAQQNASKITRSGIWKQWIYWIAPGPDAYAAIQRVAAEVNIARGNAGLPLVVTDPTNPLIISVFDETNPRGLNGSSAIATNLSNQEVFLATFVSDTAGGGEVLFLENPIRSNDVLTIAKSVPGTSGFFEHSIKEEQAGDDKEVNTKWSIKSSAGDEISFAAEYPSSAIYARTVAPASRIVFANCNLSYSADLIYRSNPTAGYTLFERGQANYIDPTVKDVSVRLKVNHHDANIQQMFGDRKNSPIVLIEVNRVVRIESK